MMYCIWFNSKGVPMDQFPEYVDAEAIIRCGIFILTHAH